jgi:hypothetical protein
MGWLRAVLHWPVGPVRLPVDEAYGDPDAALLRAALQSGDWPAARRILAGAADPDTLSFLTDVGAQVSGTETWLPDAMRRELDDTLLAVTYGARLIAWAWEARGRFRAQHVSADQFELFFERLRAAEDCLQGVVRREPDNVVAWHQLVITARGLQLSVEEARRRFGQAVAVWPYHVRAHGEMLQMLCPKWYGSQEQAFEFARSAVRAAPPGNPLGHLIATAHFERAIDGGGTPHLVSPAVRAELHGAAERSVRHPDLPPGPDALLARSWFAMTFALAGEYRAAAEQFDAIGDTVIEPVWRFFEYGPGASFCTIRNQVRRRAS